MKQFKTSEIDLPYSARSLCEEALVLAKDLSTGLDEEQFEKQGLENLEVVVGHILATGVEKFATIAPDLFTLSNYPTDPEELEAFKKNVMQVGDDNVTEFARIVNEDEESEIFGESNIAYLLYYSVYMLKALEEQLLTVSDTPNYIEAMNYIDNAIHNLSRTITFARSFVPGKELLNTKISRKKGAKKGGEAKQKRYAELRAMVIDEANARYSGLPATKAARRIAQEFNKKNLLNDENGKPIFKVPPSERFTIWIRMARK